MKILLAEDDPNISLIARLSLEQLGGHQVQVANHGEMALQLSLSNQYDLILLDEMMPKLNGMNVAKKYLSQCKNPSPIIFLSAKSQESDIQEFYSVAIGYIPKPFDPAILNRTIIEILSKQKRAA